MKGVMKMVMKMVMKVPEGLQLSRFCHLGMFLSISSYVTYFIFQNLLS